MSLGKPEKICKPCHLGYKRTAKKFTNKKRRRNIKKDIENASEKVGNYGWSE